MDIVLRITREALKIIEIFIRLESKRFVNIGVNPMSYKLSGKIINLAILFV